MRRVFDFFKTLRVRIFIVFLAAFVLPGIFFVTSIPAIFYSNRLSDLSAESLSCAQALAEQIATTGYLQDPTSNTYIDGQVVSLANATNSRVVLVDSTFRVVRDTNGVALGRVMIGAEVIRSSLGEAISIYSYDNDYVETTVPIRLSADADPIGVLLYSVPVESIKQARSTVSIMCYFLMLIVSLIGIVVGLVMSHHMVKPCRNVRREIDTIIAGGETEITAGYDDEMDRVVEGFNEIMKGMKERDEAHAQFVSNVSHELKTPLTSMKVLADTINSMGDVPLEMYKEFMGDITGEIDRETEIINDLLSLVRMDKAASFKAAPVNINELVGLIMKRLAPIAEKAKVELVLESFRPVIADIDEVKMTQAITNLVENAIKYNKEEGWVHIAVNADHEYCFIKVEDSGMGIPADSISHIFERFYRVDKSHSREIPGSGLGLAITQQAILLHRGEIKAYSVEGEGTTFNIRFPLKYIEKEKNDENE